MELYAFVSMLIAFDTATLHLLADRRYIFKANRNARKVIAKLRRVYFANKSKKGLRICGDLSVLRPPEYNASYHYKASGSVAIW